MRRAAAAVGIVIVLAAAAFGVSAVIAHETARAAYSREAMLLALGDARYDAERSDARYFEVRSSAARASHAGLALGVGLLMCCLAWGAGAPATSSAGATPAARLWVAPPLDALGVGLGIAAIGAIEDALTPDHIAAGLLAANALRGALFGVLWALLARGATPAMRALRVRVVGSNDGAPGPSRALLALLLAALLLPIAPIAALLSRWRAREPVYLAWAGLRGVPGRPTPF